MTLGMLLNGKPKHLVATTALMTLVVIALIAATILLWTSLPHPLEGLVLLVLGAAVLLWFYWHGYNSARWTVLILSALDTVEALSVLIPIPFLARLGGASDMTLGRIKFVFQLCICTYLVWWLSTSEAAAYFSAHARRQRTSPHITEER